MIAENIQNIKENIAKICFRCGRDSQSVKLVAVSKTFGIGNIAEAITAGQRDFGENYVQELLPKQSYFQSKSAVRWHFIGHLQSNKVKYIAEWIYLIHSVDSENVAQEIQKRAQQTNRTVDILVEVNTSEEATKFGVKPAMTIGLLKKISKLSNINLKGLMTIGPFSDNKEESRAAFRQLKAIFDQANAGGFLHQPMTVLSMGMTHDYDVAIEEGSTLLRIGTAIFGMRKPKNNILKV